MMRFFLVCDGRSDTSLINHIQRLLVESGATEANGDTWHHGGKLADKVSLALTSSSAVDLLFIHRDAEHPRNTGDRYREIESAIREVGYDGPWVPVVPVRMTEAWLLLDENSIRKVAGRPRDTTDLMLPRPRDVEGILDPKDRLNSILRQASGASGRRLRRMHRELPRMRNQLLQDLELGGLLEQVPSWARFRDDTLKVLIDLGIRVE